MIGSVKLIFGYGLIVTMLWMASQAYSTSFCIDKKGLGCLHPNSYTSAASIQNRSLATLVNSKFKTLQLMVWETDRRRVSLELSDLLQKKINLNPFDSRHWAKLSYVQKDAGASTKERAWSIERAARLSKWNYIGRSEITHYCITDYQVFQNVSPSVCSDLLTNLPSIWSVELQAIRANVPFDLLQSVLELEENKLGAVKE